MNAVDVVVQQMGRDAVNRLRKGLEQTYFTVRVPCLVTLTCVFGVAATSIHWKGERSGYDGVSEPAESLSS